MEEGSEASCAFDIDSWQPQVDSESSLHYGATRHGRRHGANICSINVGLRPDVTCLPVERRCMGSIPSRLVTQPHWREARCPQSFRSRAFVEDMRMDWVHKHGLALAIRSVEPGNMDF